MESPVSVGELPFDPNSRFNEPEGLDVLFPAGSACQRKSCATAFDVLLLNEEACQSSGFELKPLLAVAVPVVGIRAPAAVIRPLNVLAAAESAPVKAPVVPLNPPVRVPPVSRK